MAEIPERKRLIEYLPPFMRRFKELQQITSSEDKQMSEIDECISRMIDEAFITDCGEYGVKKYETLLGIMPDSGDTLSDRKEMILAHWRDFLPYTIRTLIRRLNVYCGDDFEITGNLADYELEIHTHILSDVVLRDIEKDVDHMIPENMHISIFNSISREINGNIYGSGAVVTGVSQSIETKNKTVTIGTAAYCAATVAIAKKERS